MKSGICLLATLSLLVFAPQPAASPNGELARIRGQWPSHRDGYPSKDAYIKANNTQARLVHGVVDQFGLAELVNEVLSQREFLDEVLPHLFSRAMAGPDWELAGVLLRTVEATVLSAWMNIEAAVIMTPEGEDLEKRITLLLDAYGSSQGRVQRELGEAIERAFGSLFDEKHAAGIAMRMREHIATGARLQLNQDYPWDWSDAVFHRPGYRGPIVRIQGTLIEPK